MVLMFLWHSFLIGMHTWWFTPLACGPVIWNSPIRMWIVKFYIYIH